MYQEKHSREGDILRRGIPSPSHDYNSEKEIGKCFVSTITDSFGQFVTEIFKCFSGRKTFIRTNHFNHKQSVGCHPQDQCQPKHEATETLSNQDCLHQSQHVFWCLFFLNHQLLKHSILFKWVQEVLRFFMIVWKAVRTIWLHTQQCWPLYRRAAFLHLLISY